MSEKGNNIPLSEYRMLTQQIHIYNSPIWNNFLSLFFPFHFISYPLIRFYIEFLLSLTLTICLFLIISKSVTQIISSFFSRYFHFFCIFPSLKVSIDLLESYTLRTIDTCKKYGALLLYL